jgi:hypothetical protein
MHTESVELIVNKLLVGCLSPYLILGEEGCSRLELSPMKEVLLFGNHEAFLKTSVVLSFEGIILSYGRILSQMQQTFF